MAQAGHSHSSRTHADSSARVSLNVSREGQGVRLALSGDLTVHTLPALETPLRNALRSPGGPALFDLQQLGAMDTAGALLLNKAVADLKARGLEATFRNLSEQQEQLLKQSVLPETSGGETRQTRGRLYNALGGLGKTVSEGVAGAGQLTGFLGQFLVTLVGVLVRPHRLRWTSLVFHMEQVGLRAVPIVSLLTFLIGLVVAYMGAQQLSMFGADIFAVNLLEVTVLREMAVLITAIVVAGRSSSSFTAQIGAMVANEEVDAMRSMGLDPGALLVLPRVLALILCLPMLVFLADIMALLGGALAIWVTIDINFYAFLTQFQNVAKVNNFFVGMVKTPFFALSIGLVGCFQGFRATGSAESVGFLTTVAVVQSIFIVILVDALFAILFSTIGV